MLGLRRTGPPQCNSVLAALGEAERQRLILTDQELYAELSGKLNTWTAQQSLRLLERVGLLTRSRARIEITKAHLWVERRISLTAAGRAVARCALADESLRTPENVSGMETVDGEIL